MNVYFRLQHHCFGMVGKQWLKKVRMTGRTSDSLSEGLPIKMTREKFQRK